MTQVPASLVSAYSPEEVEQQFYEALRQARIEPLMALWADEDDTICVHPGGPRVVGAAAIRSSFEAIFTNGGIPVRAEHIHRLQTATAAVHSVLEYLEMQTPEGLQTAWVVSTNIYALTSSGWRLLAHHSSPADPQDISALQPPAVLH